MCCKHKRIPRDGIADVNNQRRPIIIKTPLSMLIQYIIDSRAAKRAGLRESHEPVSEVVSKPRELHRLETQYQGIEHGGFEDRKEGHMRTRNVDMPVLPRYSQAMKE
ncbi:hypothetical protein IFR05_006423 [Cadophora sp. M221]|nr:hypothetical protein IFR05_006423 [Cadophora sp. M221]